MMLIPIVICAAAIGWLVGKKTSPEPQHFSKVSGVLPRPSSYSALEEFTRVIRSGQTPTAWLVTDAVRDAYEQGQWEVASQIAIAFDVHQPMIPHLVSEPLEEDVPGSTDAPAQSVETPPASNPEARSFSSPINGIPDEDWTEFTSQMADKAVDFADDKYVGQFCHNRKRLSQLQIDPKTLEGSQEKQYEAFSLDIRDHFERNKSMLNEVVQQPIIIDGDEHVISLSGALALLKAAGTENARSWIGNPERRSKYPHTTDLFLRCNNLF